MASVNNDLRLVVNNAAKSRLIVLVAQLIFNLVIPDHNSLDAYRSPYLTASKNRGVVDVLIQDYLFAGLNRWDSHYFITIASEGYQREDLLAFFPLYPLCLRWFSFLIVRPASFGLIDGMSALMVTSVLVNIALFIFSSICLFKLTHLLFNNRTFALDTSLWFSYNPASIFFSANYSESLFSALTFSGLFLLQSNRDILAVSLLGLSSATRSNAVVSLGFVLQKQLSRTIRGLFYGQKDKERSASGVLLLARSLLFTLLSAASAVGPFGAYQLFSYYQFCSPSSSSPQNQTVASDASQHLQPAAVPDWCASSSLPYSVIQGKYWNLGFLRYFVPSQAPNFLLAAPIVLIILRSSFHYLVRNWRAIPSSLGLEGHSEQATMSKTSGPGRQVRRNCIWTNEACLVYVVHALFMTLFGMLFIHVQVLTRLICSSSPLLYWIAASAPRRPSRERTILKAYFGLYFVLGIALHCNFLPWT